MEYKLEELIEVKHGYAFKGKDFSEIPTNRILVTPGNILIGGGFNAEREKYYSEEVDFPEEYLLTEDDLVLTMTDLSKEGDTLGYPGLIPSSIDKMYLHNQRIGKVTIKKSELINKDYLYFLFKTREYRHHVLSSASGTTVKHTSPSKILSYKVVLPELAVQERVSKTLMILEEKIILNKNMTKTLEQLAEKLFKRWFVDFEFPNSNGEPYKSSGGEMVESELGMIPERWNSGKLSDIATLIMGQSPKSETYNEDGIGMPLINGASDFKKDQINPLKYTTDPKRVSQKGDFLFGVRATVGNVTYVDKVYALGRGVGVARANTDKYHGILYFQLINGIDYLKSIATGSVYINFTKNDLEGMRLVIPNSDVVKKYHETTKYLFAQKNLLITQNDTLANLRDTLLPKLLSGEIELPDETEVTEDVSLS